MAWFNKSQYITPVAPPVPVAPTPASAVTPDVSGVVVGDRIGNLTCLGNFYMAFDEMAMVNLCPADGCGAEITLRNGARVVHLNAYGAACLKKYLNQERAKLAASRDEVRQLEELVNKETR